MASLDVLLVMALKEESQGLFEATGITPLYTGVGLVKTTYKLQQWIAGHQPKHIINLGTVGSKKIAKGTLVECTSFIQRAPHAFLQINSKIILGLPGVTWSGYSMAFRQNLRVINPNMETSLSIVITI